MKTNINDNKNIKKEGKTLNKQDKEYNEKLDKDKKETNTSGIKTNEHEQQLLNNVTNLRKLILEKEQEVKQNLELSKFLQAEIENLKKRHKKEIIENHNYAIKNFAKKLLNVADSIEDGIHHIKNNEKINIMDVKEGLDITNNMLISLLKDFNIHAINTENVMFNQEYHEAISIVKNEKKEDNIILKTIQKGYMINKMVLRTSKVVVCKNS